MSDTADDGAPQSWVEVILFVLGAVCLIAFMLAAISNVDALDATRDATREFADGGPEFSDYVAAVGQSAGYLVAGVVCWSASGIVNAIGRR